MAMHIDIQMPVFSLGQFFSGQGGEHALRTFGLFAMIVIRVLASGRTSENHECSLK